MFTGYPGLVYGSAYDQRVYTITDICDDMVEIAYKLHGGEGAVYYRSKDKVESTLNQQGKAPKRIQYEVYLNAFYKNTDNAIDKMDAKYYSLDKLVSEYSNPPYEIGDRLYYAPACKLPPNYLPKVSVSSQYINKAWSAPSTQLPKGYLEFCESLKKYDNAINVFYYDQSNAIIYSDNWIDYGQGISGWFCNPDIWVNENLYAKAPYCTLPEDGKVFLPEQASFIGVQNVEYLDDGRLGVFDHMDDTPLWHKHEGYYQTITESQYVTVHQLNLTHYPTLQPPNDGDDTACNILWKHSSNCVIYSDGLMHDHDLGVLQTVDKNYWCKDKPFVEAPCCRLYR